MNLENVKTAHAAALLAASKAADEYLEKYGSRDACGFAWASINIDGRTKLAKTLKKIEGWSPKWNGGLQLWNPANSGTQSISILESGARAYSAKMNELLETDKFSYGSRMD